MAKDTEALFLAAAMTHFQLKDFTEIPDGFIPDEIRSAEEKRTWLHDKVAEVVDNYINITDTSSALASGVIAAEPQPKTNFMCRMEGCPRVFKYCKARNTHEVKSHNLQQQPDLPAPLSVSTKDHKKEHTVARLSFGFFLLSLRDAVREGDGERVLRLYKVALMFFKAYNHTQYSLSTFLLSVQISFTLPPKLAHSLTWNRFWNSRGGKGNNISLDLHLEHMNNFLKSFLKGLGVNLTEPSADRISRSLGVLKQLLTTTDIEIGVAKQSGRHSTPDQKKDIRVLAAVALAGELFENHPGREFESFPGFDQDLLSKLNYVKFRLWMRDKLREWGVVQI